jgi:hypothetical protein
VYLDGQVPVTPAQAHAAIAADPKKYRAAVLEGEEFPLRAHETTSVRLFELVRDANECFKERRGRFESEGFRKAFGSVALGCILFKKDDEPDVVLALDKRP